MAVLIANNAKSTLAAAIGALDTTLTVASGTETLFPSPSGGDYFYVTLEDSTGTVREIVKVTACSGTTFTIVRAQDGTLANIFALGSIVELRINKASLTDSIGAASASATAAAASATAAAGSATTAAGSASSAATSASTATTQASNASTSATNAANSASAANTSAIAAAAAAASGLYSAVQDKSANYTVVAGDAGDLIRVTTTSGAVTITLPTISTVGDGFKIAVVKWTSDGNPVNVNRSGSDTINGGVTAQIGSQYSQIILVADLETNTWFASQSGLGATNVNVDVFSGNGSTTVYTLTADPSTKNNTYVSISGVYQAKSTYSVSGTTLTFSQAPPSGTSNIEVVYGSPLAIGTPSDGTVSSVKLSSAQLTLPNALNEATTVTLASSGTVSIGAATANTINISGTTTITAFGTIAAGAVRRLVFAGALTLTHNATSLILPSAANITTAAGDVAELVSLGSGNWRCFNYMKANGQPVVAPAGGGGKGQAFTTTGSGQTFTIPTGVTAVKVTVVGAGGGGANYTACYGQSGGGGAGATAIKYLTGLTPGNTLTVTVGAGGATLSSGGTSSVASGTQSITTITATGGGAGMTVLGGAGGAASNGDINSGGGYGTIGAGGGSSFGTSATVAVAAAVPASTARGAGGGGGGTYSGGGTNGNTGGAGAAGVVIFEW